MKEITEDKGRVRPVVEGDFQCDENGNSTRFYEILSIIGYIKDDGTKIGYISKTDVPIGTPITDTDYWYPFQVIAVPKGDKGDTGADGKSAYDLYMEHGGTITPVEAWLASLQGKDGADGKDGTTPIIKISDNGMDILISSDNGETWYKLVSDFTKLRILGFVDSIAKLPKSADVGDIYGVWNADAQEGQGAYELYINLVTGWNLDGNITKVYEYETELPASAADGTVAIIPQKGLTLDKEKIDGYKVYKYSLAQRGWIMILNTSEIFASKEDIINHGDNLYALVQGDIQRIPHTINNWINGTLDVEESYAEDDTSIIGTCSIEGTIETLKYNITQGYTVDIRILSDNQFDPSEIVSPSVLVGTEGPVQGSGEIGIPLNSKSLIVIIKKIDSEEPLPVSAGTYLSLYNEVINVYELYARQVEWQFFGTNASIIYHLIQNIQEGTESNIPSGKAVKDALNQLNEAKVDKEEGKSLIDNDYVREMESSEFVRLYITPENKILWGLTVDGDVFYGAGVPKQVVTYVEQRITDLKLDSVEDILTFLDGLQEEDKTLRYLLDNKLDAVSIDSSEFIRVILSSNNKLVEGTRTDGSKLIGGDVSILGSVFIKGFIETLAHSVMVTDNPEFAIAWLTSTNKVLFGAKNDGDIYFGYGVPSQIKTYISTEIAKIIGIGDITVIIDTLKEITEFLVGFESGSNLLDYLNETYGEYKDNPEFVKVILDNQKKLTEGTRTDGTKVFPAGIETSKVNINGITYNIISNDEYLLAFIDNTNKVLLGLKVDGKTVVGDADFYTSIRNNKEAIDYIKSTIHIDINNWDILTVFESFETPEYINTELDSERKIIAGRTQDGVKHEYVGLDTPNVFVGGHTIKDINDPEERTEIVTDNKSKIISYRDSDGVKHENVGIKSVKVDSDETSTKELNVTEHLNLSESAKNDIKNIDGIGDTYKAPKLPKYGYTNIKTETFYLTANPNIHSIEDVELRQDYDDNVANGVDRMSIYHYYIGNTRLRHYAAKKVKLNSSDNKYYAKETIRKVNNVWYYADTLGYIENDRIKVISGYTEEYTGSDIPAEGNYGMVNTEVVQVTGPACVGAWTVEDRDFNYVEGTDIGKKFEHWCICDVNFGYYFTKNNVAIGVKYQGNSTMNIRKRNFRYTFYKNNTYAKKDKIKIGELLRLSGFNLKSNFQDPTRLREIVLYRLFVDIWQNRPITDRYDWDNEINGLYHGATGTIQQFPIRLSVNGDFYGIYTFGLKKDEKNYMLDGEDESGLMVSGSTNSNFAWGRYLPYSITENYDEEMLDEMSQSTIDALQVWHHFINNRLYKGSDNNEYNSTELTDVSGTMYVTSTLEGGQVVEGSVSATLIEFNKKNIPERLDVLGFIDYFIGMQMFIMIDNCHNNIMFYSNAEKKKLWPFFYDLDGTIVMSKGYDADILAPGVSYCSDVSLWENFIDIYWDEIVNRYCELRKDYLSLNKIKDIYHDIVSNIPDIEYTNENNKWGTSISKNGFDTCIEFMEHRLEYLDNTYFKI